MSYAAPLTFSGSGSPTSRATAWVLMLLICWQPTFTLAEVVPLAPDGLRPTLDAAANGTPVINIADPNRSGLSHNRYDAFNVDQQGLILNNSQEFIQTDLAGYIDLNPNLVSGSATIILNEVLTNNPSQLLGHIEVAGQQADVIIANPYGITCDGCGFINSHRATLTTGVPMLSEAGALSGFDVRTGQVNIDGAGINASNISRFDILARSIALNAEVHGQEINIHGGAGQVSYGTLASTGTAVDGAPAFAISSSALGGIYGDRIRLLATEQGVGVNLLAPVAAQTGDLTLSASGEVRYATLAASGAAVLSSDAAIVGSGDLLAGGALLLNASEVQLQDGTLTGRSIAITADHLQLDSPAAVVLDRSDQQLRIDVQSLNNGGRLHGEGGLQITADMLQNSGIISSSRALSVEASALVNQGTIGGLGHSSVNATSLDNMSGGLLYGGNGLRLWSGTLINRGDIYSRGNLTIENGSGTRAGLVENRSGTIEATGNVRILAENFLNLRDVFDYDDLLVSGTASWDCGSCAGFAFPVDYQITETRQRTITQNSASASLFAGGSLYISSSVLDNQYSTIGSGAGMTLIADQYLRNVALDGNAYLDTYIYSTDVDVFEHNENVSGPGNTINRYNQINAAGQDPATMLAAEDTLVSRYGLASRETHELNAAPLAQASIVAGGNLSVSTPQQINSGVGAQALDNLGEQAVRDMVPSYDDATVSVSLSQFNGTDIDGSDLVGLLDRVNGGILSYASAGSGYLIETDPLFTHFGSFINSTYLLNRLGWDPDEYDLLLGNGYVELLLLRELILKATGRVLLTDSYRSEQQQYQALMDNAIYAAEALDLIPGVALTADQMNALQQDIVWLEKQEVMGQTVLVPTLYLAAGSADIRSDGAVIAASGGMRVDAGGMLNSGDLQAGGNMKLHAGDGGVYNSGAIEAGGNLLIASDGHIENLSGLLSANQMLLRSKQDIVHSRAMGDNGAARAGLIDARGNLVMVANNIGVHGSDVGARNVTMDARGNIVIDSFEQHETSHDTDRHTVTTTNSATQLGGHIRAAVNLVMRAGDDIDAAASHLEAGRNLALRAEGDVRLVSRENRTEQHAQSTIPWHRSHSESLQVSQVGSEVSAGRKMTVSGRNVEVAGSSLAANRLHVRAAENILIRSAEDESSRHSRTGRNYSNAESITQIPSELSATLGMLLVAGGNMDIVASDVAAGRSLQLQAGGDIGVFSAEDYEHSDSYRRSGSKRVRRISTDVTQRAATLTAGGGLSLNAGNDITTVSAKMSAGQDISLKAGNDVNLLAAKDSSSSYSKVKKKRWYGSKTTVKSSYEETVQETTLEAGGGVLVNVRRDRDGNLLHTRNVGNVVLDAVSIVSGGDTAIYAGGDLLMAAQLEQFREFRETTRSYSGVAQIGAMAGAAILTPQTMVTGQSLELKGDSGRGTTRTSVVQATVESEGDTYLLSGGDMTLVASALVLDNFTALAGMNRGDEPGHIMLRGLHDHESDWKYESSFSVGITTDGSSISIARQQEHREHHESSDYIGTQVEASGHSDVSTDGDILLIGSSLNTAGNARFEAGGSISLLEDVNRSRNYQSTVTRDLRIEASSGDSRAELFAGYQEEHRQEIDTSTEVVGSSVSATNITLVSGKDVTLSGAMLYAQKLEEDQRGISGNVVIDAAGDINTLSATDEKSLSVINETLRVGVSVGAQENISAVVDAFDSLTEAEGGLNTASATLQTVDSLNGARSGAVTANAAVVAEWSREQRDSRQTAAVPTLIEAGGNLALRSGGDQRHVGTQAKAGGSLSLVAGGNVLMESAQNHSHSSSGSDSASMSMGLSSSNGLNVTGSGAYAKSSHAGTTHTNAVFEGVDVDIETGGDLALDGAVVKAGQLRTSIGGDLLIASHQDTGRTRGESANASLTLGTSAVSGSVGGSRTVGDRAWVEQQSGLFAEDRLDVHVAGHTSLTGGAIISESSNLDVSTASLSFSDIHDYDNFRSTSAQFGLGTPQGGAGKPEKTAGRQSLIPGLGTNSINISHQDTERRQQTSATIGEGNLTIRDDLTSGEDSTRGLNRDAAIAQQITRDRDRNYHLYLSDRSLQGVGLLDSDDNRHNSRLNQLKDTFHAGLALSEIAETAVAGINEIDNALVMGLTVGQARPQDGAGLGLLHDERMREFAGQVGDGVLAASQLVVNQTETGGWRLLGFGDGNSLEQHYDRNALARMKYDTLRRFMALREEGRDPGLPDLVDIINNITDYQVDLTSELLSVVASELAEKGLVAGFYQASGSGLGAAAAGVHDGSGDRVGVNIDKTNVQDPRAVVATLGEEAYHARSDADDTYANMFGDRLGYLWEKQNRAEGRSTGGVQTVLAWRNQEDTRQHLEANSRAIATADPLSLEFRQFRRREASALDQARYLIANKADLGEQEKRQQILMLEAKACAAVRCAEGLPASDSHYDLLLRLQEYGDAITEMSGDIYGDLEELGVASSYRWRHGRSSGTTRLFYYSPDDVVVDVTSSNTDGAVQTVANKADAAWHTGATVVAANVAAVSGSEHMEGYRDDMIEQNIAAWGKEYQSVVGERVLNSMSAETYQDPSNYVLDLGLVVADAVPLLGLAKKGGEAVEKTAEALRNLNRAIGDGLQAQHAMRRADDLGAQLAVVSDATDDLAALAIRGKYANRTDVRYRTADEVNSEFAEYSPPYQPGTRVTEYTSIESDQFVRVHGEGNAARSWMMKREAIEGLSPQEIARKYSLPEVPTKISDVNVPAGTRIRTGKVASNFDGNEGAVQYQWIGRVPESAITNTRYLNAK